MKPHILKTRRSSRAVAKTAKLRRPVAKRSRRKAERPPIPVAAAAPAADQKRPTGKLGRVLNAVAATRGASLDELVELTGWQPHTARATAAPLVVTVPLLRRRTGRDTRLLMDGPEATQPDPSLVRMLVRARTCKAKLLQSGEARLTETSRSVGISRSYLTRLARLAFLAPDIVCAILEGRQPAQLTAARLIRITQLPLDWSEQRKALGLG